MRNFKKVLVALLLVLTAFGLTSCTQLNRVSTYFEEQGYQRYQYDVTTNLDSYLFGLHDDLTIEEMERLGYSTDTEETTVETTEATTTGDGETTTTEEEQEYFGFDSYVFSNGVIMAVVMEFESESFLEERLADSEVLQTWFEGLDPEDYINGNCLLVVYEDYMDNYDHFVDIFQGRLDPITTVETTTVETTTEAETTTAAE